MRKKKHQKNRKIQHKKENIKKKDKIIQYRKKTHQNKQKNVI